MNAVDDRTRVGLTAEGVRLYLAIRAVFNEHAVWTEKESPEGEPLLQSTEESLLAMVRRWEGLWNRAGLGRDVARESALMEMALRPRSLRELDRRLFRKDRIPPTDARRAVADLMEAGLATDDLERVYVAD